MSPPATSKVKPPEKLPSPTARVSPKKGRTSTATTDPSTRADPKATVQAPADGPVAMSFKNVVAAKLPAPTPIVGTDETSRLGITPLREIDPVQLFRRPPSEVPKVDLEEMLSKTPPVELKDNLTAKEEKAEATRRALANYQDDHPLREEARKMLETQLAEIEKLKRKTPGHTVAIEQLRSAKQSHVQHAAEQRQRAAEGMQRAANRKDIQVSIIDEVAKQLQQLKTGILAAHADAAQAWAEYQVKREDQWTSILAEFDARVAALAIQPQPAPPPTPAMIAVPSSPRSGALQLLDNADPVLRAQRDAQDAFQKLAAAQVAAQAAVQAQAAAEQQMALIKAAAKVPEHELGFEGDPSELPTMVPEPQGEQWTQLHNLWTALDQLKRQEAFTGFPIPVTFAQLQAGLAVPQLLLGSAIWAKAYPGTPPTLDTVVTVQVRSLMAISMEAHQAKLVADRAKQEEARLATEAGIAAAVTEYRTKRRRGMEPEPAAIADGSGSHA